jgi:serine/threonine-protein kinase
MDALRSLVSLLGSPWARPVLLGAAIALLAALVHLWRRRRHRRSLEGALTGMGSGTGRGRSPSGTQPDAKPRAPQRASESRRKSARAAPSHAGARMGRYRLKRCIAQGEWAGVYEALDQASGERVVVKLFHLPSGSLDDGTDTAQTFDRELLANQRLEHPGIVRLLDFGRSGGQPYLVMEYMRWQTLAACCTPEHRLDWPTIAAVLVQLAEALQHAHERGVVHRDIKAENVFFDPATRCARVGDFGIARLQDAARTATGVLLGTPGHMAPEQIGGAPIGPRTDVYALGTLAYQLLTSRLPHEGYHGAELLRQITQGEVAPLENLRPDIPTALAHSIRKALERDPRQRWASCAQWAHHLRETIGIETPLASANIEPRIPR